jgi:hypothetical protein
MDENAIAAYANRSYTKPNALSDISRRDFVKQAGLAGLVSSMAGTLGFSQDQDLASQITNELDAKKLGKYTCYFTDPSSSEGAYQRIVFFERRTQSFFKFEIARCEMPSEIVSDPSKKNQETLQQIYKSTTSWIRGYLVYGKPFGSNPLDAVKGVNKETNVYEIVAKGNEIVPDQKTQFKTDAEMVLAAIKGASK